MGVSEVKTIEFTTPVGINQYKNVSSSALDIYPNPIKSEATISYSINKSGPVTLEIYNMLGEKIITLLNTNLTTGDYQIRWDCADENKNQISSGVYLCNLKTKDQTTSIKIIVN